MTSTRKMVLVAFFLALSATLLSSSAWRQTTGSFEGTVTDPSGAAITGAKITVASPTGLVRTAESNAQGAYLVPLLPPDVYEINAEASGFQKYIRTDVPLQVNQVNRVDVSMTIGTSQQKVSVRGEETTVDTATPTISQVITNKEVTNLPLNGRNFLQLTVLVPGSVPGIPMTNNFTPTTQGTSSLNLPQVNGLRNQSNNVCWTEQTIMKSSWVKPQRFRRQIRFKSSACKRTYMVLNSARCRIDSGT